jgi:High-affinity nickel permease
MKVEGPANRVLNRKSYYLDRLSSPMLPKRVIVGFYASMLVLVFALFIWLADLSDKLGGAMTGLGSLAFFFGLRHAVDADHLAAIDNSVRKLTQEGRESLFAGTFFSLGHSTVVVLLSAALIFVSRELVKSVPQLQSLGGLLGTLISGGVLYLLGSLNLIVALEIYALFRGS